MLRRSVRSDGSERIVPSDAADSRVARDLVLHALDLRRELLELLRDLQRDHFFVAAVTAYSTKVYVWVNPGGGDPAAGTFTTGTQGGKACLISNGQYLTSTTSAQPLAILQLW